MNQLSVTDSPAVLTVICAIVGGVWVLLQIGDRLWFKKDKPELPPEIRDPELFSSIASLIESQRKLLESQAEMTKATTAMLAESRAGSELGRMRHEEVIRMLTQVERQTSALLAREQAHQRKGDL